MNIAMVSEHANPLATPGSTDAGGQNVHVAALSRALAQMGHQVTVYTRRDRADSPDEVALAPGVSVVHVPAGPPEKIGKDDILPWMPHFGQWLRHRWAFQPPDIVHSHFWMSGLAALAAVRDAGIPLVHTFHALGVVKRRHQGADDTSPPERLRTEAAVARGVDTVIATCGDEARELSRMRVPRRSVRVVPCGVDRDHFTTAGPSAPRPNGRRVLSIGRLVPRKGVDTLIEAMRLVPDAELVVAGGPPPEELDQDPDVARLREAASEAGVAGRIRFVGQVAHHSVPPLMRSADLAVCVPWYEPFGMVALEAMACGVPVIASAVGGQCETVVNGVTGVLVPPRRPRELATAINTLLDEPALRAEYAAAGAARARQRYAWSRVAAETVAVYEEIVARRRVPVGRRAS